MIEVLGGPIPQRIENVKGMIRYFVHLDNPEKHQYSKNDLVVHCGADVSKYFTSTGGERLKILSEIQEWIVESGCSEFSDLADYAANERFDDWYEVVSTQSTLFLNTYIRSKRHIKKDKENEEKERSQLELIGGSEEERFLRSVTDEFNKINKSGIADRAKIIGYAGLLSRIERRYSFLVLKPTEDDKLRPEVLLYDNIKLIKMALENEI